MTVRARDGFETYFAEKLWEMIPAVYRDEDGRAERPGALRAFIEVLAGQAAILRRGNDRLWDDQFIELCADWAVPYIGELVGTRMVSALNPRGRRVDVAKTIYYRRRKGTPRVIEELIGDITGWEGKVVEMFRRLGRTRHGLDPAPAPLAGRFTATPPGGLADLRRPRGAELAGGPFDEYHHTADVRRHRGTAGRHGIPKLALHLYRLPSLPLEGVTPAPGPTPQTLLLDPSGRDVPLFARRDRPADWDEWRSALEWELPAPIRCRVLGHAEYVVTEALIVELETSAGLTAAAAAELRTLRGVRFPGERRLRDWVATLSNGAAILAAPVFQPLLAGALVEECGLHALVPGSLRIETAPGTAIARDRIAAGSLEAWSGSATGKRVVVDPERGRLLFLGAPPPAGLTVSYHYGFSGEVGAGSYDRSAGLRPAGGATIAGGGAIAAADIAADGVTQIDDSATYGPVADKSGVRSVVIQAADRQRPYLRLASSWVLDTTVHEDATLVLDGLWIGAGGGFSLVLRGDYESVRIVRTTLDPGGEDALGAPIPPVPLVVEGHVEELVVERSIVGPIRTEAGGVVERLVLRDSIVQSVDDAVPAIALPAATVEIGRPDPTAARGTERPVAGVTIFGAVDVNRLHASEALITGPVDVTDVQDGCFRFGAAPAGSRLPHPYESHLLEDAAHLFTSRRFGHPGYAQLAESAPRALRRGAENGSEIGAFGHLMNPIKLDGLRAKVEEFAPFGLIPLIIFET